MLIPTLLNKINKNNSHEIGLAEAHYLWHIIKAKYDFLHVSDIWTHQVHDKDLLAIIKIYTGEIHSDIKTWEKYLNIFGVRGPDGYTPAAHTISNPQLIRDQLIATLLFTFSQAHINMLIKSFRNSTTNDDIKNLFRDGTKKAVKRFSLIAKYIKTKGWIAKQPMYHNQPANSNVEVCAGEALHLWDHLSYRNDNIEMTQTFISFVKDSDFKLLLERGLQSLVKQARRLEKELIQFKIPLPDRPPNVMPPAATKDLINDDNIFRWIYQGIQGALSMHALSLVECVHNDRIRNLFSELLFNELDMLSSITKYGKLKGWLNPTLRYGMLR